ncbi:MAG: phosphoribosylformylglycinamidine cyclo-ligase [Bacteriovoracaceae bacterium]|nr:phosphoribosylformylglycinamidine cyclo-ligase [Bacteriovoracaceae bacterium]
MSLTYKDSGVDIDKGEALVEKIKGKVKKTYGKRVIGGVGGFACLYEVADRYLAAGTDGVGTKLKLAFDLNKHDTVGIDLVAMCVNDIICTGAKPLFFMDYLATGKLDLPTSEAIIDGIVEGCLQCEAALIGGETAEMPGMYSEGEYDLAGFAVGEVYPNDILGGEKVRVGQSLLAIASDGFHSNGYSLIRRVLQNNDHPNIESLLRPTKIYWKAVKGLLEKRLVTGMAHITGGGLLNIPRMNESLGYKISLSAEEFREKFFNEDFQWIQEKGNISTHEMLKTFNGGIGLVIASENPDEVIEHLKKVGETAYLIGEITETKGLFLGDSSFS